MVHGTRFISELAYQDLILNEVPNHEFFSELGAKEKLIYYPTVTREEYPNQGRVTTAIETGELFEKSVCHVSIRKLTVPCYVVAQPSLTMLLHFLINMA